jgi:DNA polymerase-3 subunit delta
MRTSVFFGSRKLIDLRIPSGKPGIDGAKALEASPPQLPNPNPTTSCWSHCRARSCDQSSAWFTALADASVAIAVFALERDEAGLDRGELAHGSDSGRARTIAFLADRCEGNLFAAKQEIAKLGLLLPEGEIPHDAVERAVTDVARYDILQLSEAWLVGDPARALKIIESLETEGEGLPLLLWQLGEDLHALAAIREAAGAGTPMAVALRNARVWGRRQGAMERAAKRVSTAALTPMLRALARLDALSKGIGAGAWNDLRDLALTLAGHPAVPLATR